MKNSIVIIGSGLAGINLVKELRKINVNRSITLLTKDDGAIYSKPMLSTGFTKNKNSKDMCLASARDFSEEHDISVHTFTEVTHIDPSEQVVTIDNNKLIHYEDLVLAVGAEVIQPKIEGNGIDKVFSVNSLTDYSTFREQLQGARKLLIFGAGLIGSEFSNDLVHGDFQVEIVDLSNHILSSFLPAVAASAVRSALENHGIKFHLGSRVLSVHKSSQGVVAHLENGTKLSADLVLSAVGLRPNTALAQIAGLEINRGIVVDKKLRTSQNNIYALGDCAEINGHVLQYVMPLMASARALAKTLSGTETEANFGVMPVIIKTPFCPIVVVLAPKDIKGEWHIEQSGSNVKALFFDNENQLRGYALTGDKISEKTQLNTLLPPVII